jgi:hypothetical protein
MNDSKVITTYGLSSPYKQYLFCLQFMNDSKVITTYGVSFPYK